MDYMDNKIDCELIESKVCNHINKPWQSNFVSLHPFLLDAAEHKIIHCLFIILLFLSCVLIFQRLGGIMAALDDSCNSLQAEESEKIFAKVKIYLIVVKL